MHISGTTRVFLILGDPVAQVRAPEVFNHLFRKHGEDAVLVPVQVELNRFDAFMKGLLHARNVAGLWLAIPHKTGIVRYVNKCDDFAHLAGAANAVRRAPDGELQGALFDGIGFVKALAHFGVPTRGKRVLIVGIGGAGMAIAGSLGMEAVTRMGLYDAIPGRAQGAAHRLKSQYGARVEPAIDADPTGWDIVVNATPLGLNPDDPLPFDVSRLRPGTIVIDILMTRQPTPLLRACAERGIEAYPGFEMLVQQTPNYLDFFGMHSISRAVQEDASEVRALLQPR
jgi:shikimate dehydrogenase